MRIKPEEFKGKDTKRIYLASALEEAQKVEDVLDSNNIDYFVEMESFVTGFGVLVNEGAAFYVLAEKAPWAIESLNNGGLKRGVDED
jgi:hypothetical protein